MVDSGIHDCWYLLSIEPRLRVVSVVRRIGNQCKRLNELSSLSRYVWFCLCHRVPDKVTIIIDEGNVLPGNAAHCSAKPALTQYQLIKEVLG
jgi:hypothetical protein